MVRITRQPQTLSSQLVELLALQVRLRWFARDATADGVEVLVLRMLAGVMHLLEVSFVGSVVEVVAQVVMMRLMRLLLLNHNRLRVASRISDLIGFQLVAH